MTETATEVFRTPDERFADLPGYDFAPNYAEIDGLRVHYVDEQPAGDAGATAKPIVCFHGEPSWSYLYRRMVAPLVAAGHRVICPDLVGFGRSDKPTSTDWYTYDRHVAAMTALLNDHLDVQGATAVVQDWGGPIGLRWAMENRERLHGLVVMNTGLFTGRVSKGFMAWRDFAEKVGRDLPVGKIIEGATATDLSPEVVAAYDAPFPGPEAKAGAAMFPLLVPLDEDAAGAREMAWTLEQLRSFDGPALVAFSDSDPVFPHPKSGQVFVDLLPTATEQVTIEGAAHFLQEDKGERIAEEIVRFLG